jgi:hypothetical protein
VEGDRGGSRLGLSAACHGAAMPSTSDFKNGRSKGGRPWHHRPRGRGGDVSWCDFSWGAGRSAPNHGHGTRPGVRSHELVIVRRGARGLHFGSPRRALRCSAFFDSKQRRIKGEGDDMSGPMCKQL